MEWIGYLAATLTTLSFVPQVVHTIRARDTRAISLGMYILLVIGTTLWFVYGVILRSFPMILANAITVILSSVVLGLKLAAGSGSDQYQGGAIEELHKKNSSK